VLPTDDVTFPKDWAAKSKLRDKLFGSKMSDKEVALVKALNSVLSVDFDEKSLKSVLEYLQDRTGQSIIVDPISLKEANADYTDPVSLKVNKATFRTILKTILARNGLTYVIQEGTLQVVTPARAREMMVVRTYPINDIVAATGVGLQFGPFLARQQMLSNVQTLINTIQSSVDPTLWQPNGPGSIQFYEPGMALIIRAPTEFHYQLAGGGMFGGSR
jgi:type II secretory pathway component GspD/PulD (secretin)